MKDKSFNSGIVLRFYVFISHRASEINFTGFTPNPWYFSLSEFADVNLSLLLLFTMIFVQTFVTCFVFEFRLQFFPFVGNMITTKEYIFGNQLRHDQSNKECVFQQFKVNDQQSSKVLQPCSNENVARTQTSFHYVHCVQFLLSFLLGQALPDMKISIALFCLEV